MKTNPRRSPPGKSPKPTPAKSSQKPGKSPVKPASPKAASKPGKSPFRTAPNPAHERVHFKALERKEAAAVKPRPAPAVRSPSQTPLLRSEWLFTTREGYEGDLVEEQQQSKHLRVAAPRVIAPGLVASGGEYQEWAFARQALFVRAIVRAENSKKLDRAVAESIRENAAKEKALDAPWALHVWTTDTEEGNKLARTADVLERSVQSQCASIDAHWADKRVPNAKLAREAGGWVAQVCLRSPTEAVVGFQRAVQVHSMHAGGRARMRIEGDSPSRAAKKLEEAFDWFGEAPARGDRCVDLGAAPGGWTKVLLGRGAIVTAVDPGQMDEELQKNRSMTHILGSAFDYVPEVPVDWLFCDMVWRPLEVVALLAKWARRGWASMMIANVKLPMRAKGEFVHRLSETLRDGGWTGLRVRQLYHDREEVTFSANRK